MQNHAQTWRRAVVAASLLVSFVATAPCSRSQCQRLEYGDPVKSGRISSLGQQVCYELVGKRDDVMRIHFNSTRDGHPYPTFAILRARRPTRCASGLQCARQVLLSAPAGR